MKFIFTADWHVRNWLDVLAEDESIPRKLAETFSAIDQMVEKARERDIDTIIVGGDVNDTKTILSTKAFVMLRKMLTEKYSDIKWIILHGNHDSGEASGSSDVHSSIELLVSDNVEAVLKPTFIDDGRILLLPYCKDVRETLSDLLRDVEPKPEILIGHFGLDEAKLSSGISIKSDISSRHLSRVFKLVLLGHYHKPQELEQGQCKIYYVGSPIVLRRDESEDIKRFLIVDSETLSVESVETKGYRRQINIVLDGNSNIDELMKTISENVSRDDTVVIIKQMTKAIPLTFKDFLLKLENDGVKNFKVFDYSEEEVRTRGISLEMSFEQQVLQYLEIMKIPESERQEYLEVAKLCLEKPLDLSVDEKGDVVASVKLDLSDEVEQKNN